MKSTFYVRHFPNHIIPSPLGIVTVTVRAMVTVTVRAKVLPRAQNSTPSQLFHSGTGKLVITRFICTEIRGQGRD